jgi:mannosylglycoprotein endo-beta-mannosidase
LKDKDKTIDENLYWLTNRKHSYEKLNELEKVSPLTSVKRGDNGHASVEISNPGKETAFFIRLKVMNSNNELVLPAFFTENFFTLLPGDSKNVGLDFSSITEKNKLNGIKLVVEGWNVPPEEIKF